MCAVRAFIQSTAMIHVLLILACAATTLAHMGFIPEEYIECNNGLPFPDLNLSQLEFISAEDGSVVVNGTWIFQNDYNDPIGWKFTTQRLERGNWVPGIIAKEVRNFCMRIVSPMEPWYPITRFMKRHHCPFPNGHIEEFNMVNIGSLDMLFPTSFVGEWKLYMEATTVRHGKLIRECMMLPFRIEEF